MPPRDTHLYPVGPHRQHRREDRPQEDHRRGASNASESIKPFTAPDEVSQKIGDNLSHFLAQQLREGKMPKEFLPIQSGVGNVANAVFLRPGREPRRAAVRDVHRSDTGRRRTHLMEEGKCKFASTCALTFSDDAMDQLVDNIDFFRDKILMRPGEISNHPEVVRRLGLIAVNTALEADIYGNVNSTHVFGTKMMNGIGGSADFSRNAYLSIFVRRRSGRAARFRQSCRW